MTMLWSPDQHEQISRLLEALDEAIATAEGADDAFVVDVLRVRRRLGFGSPRRLSRMARAILELEQHPDDPATVAHAAAILGAGASMVLPQASGYIAPALAAALADALAERGLAPEPRLAALLAGRDLPRLLALLARLEAQCREPGGGGLRRDIIEATAAAYLATLDAGTAMPRALEDAWQAVEHEPPTSSWDDEWWSARLRVQARRDPLAALAVLHDQIVERGARSMPYAVDAVLARAIRVDRAAAWALLPELRFAGSRAWVLAGLTLDEPSAPELAPTLLALLDEWKRGGPTVFKSPSGAFEMCAPLLGAAANARRADLAAQVIATLGPSQLQILSATALEARRSFLRDDAWEPGQWEAMVGSSRPDGIASRLTAAAALPRLAGDQLAARWKLATLPLPELPWFRPHGGGLP